MSTIDSTPRTFSLGASDAVSPSGSAVRHNLIRSLLFIALKSTPTYVAKVGGVYSFPRSVTIHAFMGDRCLCERTKVYQSAGVFPSSNPLTAKWSLRFALLLDKPFASSSARFAMIVSKTFFVVAKSAAETPLTPILLTS